MVDKELIENWRNMVKPSIFSLLFKTNYEGMGEQDKEEFERDFDEILDLALIGLKHKAQLSQEDATIVAKSKRTFVELLVHYPHPDVCTYPEHKGKPYYSIKYIEDGECFVGFETYKPEVLSQYLRDYFMPPAQPERKKGHWVEIGDEPYDEWECDVCGFVIDGSGCIDLEEYRDVYRFCPRCGSDMRGEQDDERRR